MVEDKKIHANEIEGLEELLTEIVRKEFTRRPSIEDIEELKRSPAGAVIRLEDQVQTLTDITKVTYSFLSALSAMMVALLVKLLIS